MILKFQNIYHLLNNSYNLISLKLLNNGGMYQNNKQKIFYHVESKKFEFKHNIGKTATYRNFEISPIEILIYSR